MIDWLWHHTLLLSVFAVLLLMVHRHSLKLLGAHTQYRLWALLPLSLLPLEILPLWSGLAPSTSPLGDLFAILPRYSTSAAQGLTETVSQLGLLRPLFALWAAGVIALFVAACVADRSGRAGQRGSHPLWRDPTGLRRPLRIDPEAHSPYLRGWLRPVLVLPAGFDRIYTREEQALILSHESVHLARFDPLWNALASLLVLLFWFNPMIWLAYFRFRKDQELSCDERVLTDQPKATRIVYSRALIKCVEGQGIRLFTQLHYGDKHTMTERLTQIKTGARISRVRSILALLGAGTALLLASGLSQAGAERQIDAKTVAKWPVPVHRVEPRYPVKAAQQHIGGHVVMKFDISATGLVEHVSVVRSEPEGVFDDEAVRALEQWRYQASSAGYTDSLVQLDFTMDGAEAPQIERLTVKP
ncbi:TonB family protein [Ferrimonas pelagia]|uniref:Protein TonB n=1 Tax=Ferrimonas pelagia TaxID=1177826 RepID=A0ABP9ETF9_9GAMM